MNYELVPFFVSETACFATYVDSSKKVPLTAKRTPSLKCKRVSPAASVLSRAEPSGARSEKREEEEEEEEDDN